MYRRIVVPLDGSPTAERALEHALPLAQTGSAEIILVRAEEPLVSLLEPANPEAAVAVAETAAVIERTHEDVEQYLASTSDRVRTAGLRVRSENPQGHTAHAIVEVARDARADLIVLTTHGRSGVARVVFGSVAEEVVRKAPCPVLVIPTHER